MNIKRAKEEIKNTIRAYLARNSYGEYEIPVMGQRPVLLMGPPGIGKTQIMEQVARECGIGLVAYTITHHTRQSAIGLPFISEQTYGEKAVSVTQYTMSEIVAAIYNKMEETGLKRGSCSSTRSTACRRLWLRPCCSFYSIRPLETIRSQTAGLLRRRETRRNSINPSGSLTLRPWTG